MGAAATPRTPGEVRAGVGLISVRYLLPPDRVQAPPGERLTFVRVGAGSTGWLAGTDPGASPQRAPESDAVAQGTRRPASPEDEGDQTAPTAIFTEDQVDSAAVRDPDSDGPAYPAALQAAGVQGSATVEFTVDTAGRADTASFRVVEATRPEFAAAVREALPRMRFRPAVAAGRPVAQVVRLPMRFRLMRADSAAGV